MPENLLDKEAVAKRLQISQTTLSAIIKAGLIGYTRATPGKRGKVRFTESDIAAYLERNRQNATQ